MSRRLQIPGEREEAALVAACERALELARGAGPAEEWPEPGSYLAAGRVLLGQPAQPAALEKLWTLQNPDLGFPAYWSGPSQVDASASVWAALRLAGVRDERVAQLGAAVRAMGGVDAFSVLAKVEWAFSGLIPPDRVSPRMSPAAALLEEAERAGGLKLTLDLGEIGGAGQPAAPKPRGFKAWWSRTAGRRSRAAAGTLDQFERQVLEGSILDPNTRAAWLALAYAGRTVEPPGATPACPHEDRFQNGVEATLRAQESDGSWQDSEGSVHGTWRALAALRHAGYDDHEAEVLRGGEWLRSSQNADGGWGEASASTVSHTAWAVQGLVEGGDAASESVTKGIEYLLASQTPAGLWRERPWTRVIRPGFAYARDEARANADAARAIEKFMKATTRGTNG